MAVYTQLEFEEIEALVAPLGLGRLGCAHGVAAGVENSTYFLDFVPDSRASTADQYVLTIAETLSREDVIFIARLMHDLNARNLPTPSPVSPGNIFNADDAVLQVRGKPALLVPKITGAHPRSATPGLCRQIGRTLARLHLSTLSLAYKHESHRSLNWVVNTGFAVLPHLPATERTLLISELKELTEFASTHISLPQAVIHGDLFRDNVLISNGTISGIIDFFSAGTGYLLFDLAIVVNDWCYDRSGQINTSKYRELISSYCAEREPESDEVEQWGQLLRIAALRFWVSRLNEQFVAGPHAPRGRGKNPAPYHHLLVQHRHSPLRFR